MLADHLVEQLPRTTDEGLTFQILLFTRAFTHKNQLRGWAPVAYDDGVPAEAAAPAEPEMEEVWRPRRHKHERHHDRQERREGGRERRRLDEATAVGVQRRASRRTGHVQQRHLADPLLVGVADLLFYPHGVGLNIALFFVVIAIAILGLAPKRWTERPVQVAVAAALLSALPFAESFSLHWLVFALAMQGVLALAVTDQLGPFENWATVLVRYAVLAPVRLLGDGLRLLVEAGRLRLGSRVWRLLLVWIVPLVLAVSVLSVLGRHWWMSAHAESALSNPQQHAQANIQLLALRSELNKVSGQIAVLSKKLPILAKRLEAVKSLSNTAKQINGRATIAFRVCADCNEHQIDFLKVE